MKQNAKWIKPSVQLGEVCPIYKRSFAVKQNVKSAILEMTAVGTYEARLNGEKVSPAVMPPGWTTYQVRHQYQEYDITKLLDSENTLTVTVARGWYRSDISGGVKDVRGFLDYPGAIIAKLTIIYDDGQCEVVFSDESWSVAKSPLLWCNIYDGEMYDATKENEEYIPVDVWSDFPTDNLIKQEGEDVCEHEHIKPVAYIVTPKGERVIDFGQNIAGYVGFCVNAKGGEKIAFSYAEVLDSDGNFYTENYRSAKAMFEYICKNGKQSYKPSLTFWGFRYIRLDEFPFDVNKDDFTAIAVHSDIKRTGYFTCSNPLVNQLYENAIWGQKSNFIDVPMDCPQRDERLGWTGDAQFFIKAASYNFNVLKFFRKWLRDMRTEQYDSGYMPYVIPCTLPIEYPSSTAFGDAATVCPWQIYMTYGDIDILKENYSMMELWVKYIGDQTTEENLWIGGEHFGDWLDIEAPEEDYEGDYEKDQRSYKGLSDKDFIATAFYAYSTNLLIKAGKKLGKNVSEYEKLYERIVKAFQKRFTKYTTQTEHVLALHFNLTPNPEKTAESLAQLIIKGGNKPKTGFVGTPYLLHVLSENGYSELAYTLALREEYPSWLYSVKKGATTIWEHWDGIREDGSFWSKNMNSFNHYLRGSIADWFYEVVAGIKPVEEYPGFEKILIKPMADKRLSYAEASIETKYGKISSKWKVVDASTVCYDITVPKPATIVINGETHNVDKGSYIFFK